MSYLHKIWHYFSGEMYIFGGLTKTKRCLDVRNKHCLTREHCIHDFLYYRDASLVASLVLLTWSRGAILFFFLLTVKMHSIFVTNDIIRYR